MAKQRVRHSADEARRLILDAAEKRFREGGVAAVRMQLVARDVGMTDAAIHHHFGNRKGLLAALLRRASRGLEARLEAAISEWNGTSSDLASLSRLIADCYERQGYTRLATWLILSGVSFRGSGALSSLVEALRGGTKQRACDLGLTPLTAHDVQFVVALFHLIHAAEPLFGEPVLRSVGLPSDAAGRERFRSWTLSVLQQLLGPKTSHDAARTRTTPVRGQRR